MAIATRNPTVPVVDAQLSRLVAANLAGSVNSDTLRFEVAARPFGSPAPHIPSAFGIWNDVVCFWSAFRHFSILLAIRICSVCRTVIRLSMPFLFGIYRTNRGSKGVCANMENRLRDKLRIHRKKLGLSLDELAVRTGSSKSYLWELENRDLSRPSAEKLTRIATELGVTAEYLLDEGADLTDTHVKEAFFRKFSGLSADDQDRIRDMIDAWGQKK